jgi:hypothetical protein
MRHVLHLMKPARPGGGGDAGGPTGQDEISRRVAPGDAPHHAWELNQAPVVRDFLIFQMPDALRGASAPHSPRRGSHRPWVLNVFRDDPLAARRHSLMALPSPAGEDVDVEAHFSDRSARWPS